MLPILNNMSGKVQPISNAPSIYNFETNNIKYVQVFIEFLRLGEMDTMHEKYIAEVLIESKWTDHNNLGKYDPNVDWNPKLFIENLISVTKENITYTVTKENGLNVITEIRQTQGKVSFKWFFISF